MTAPDTTPPGEAGTTEDQAGWPKGAREMIAAAIANARGMRRGVPTIMNILDILPPKLRDEVLDDAENVMDCVRIVSPDLAEDIATAVAAERERIAAALEQEADLLPCEEDAGVMRSCAALVRADFSHDEAEAAASRSRGEGGK